MSRTAALALVVALVALGACRPIADPGTPHRLDVRVREVFTAPGGSLDSPVALGSGDQLVFTYTPAGSVEPRDARLYAVAADGSGFRRLILDDELDCRSVTQSQPRRLADGKVAYLHRCLGPFDARHTTSIRTYDPRTGESRSLLPYYINLNSKYFTFAPDEQRGLVNTSSPFAERLEWLLPERKGDILPLPLERAGIPSWAPDGNAIALDGIPVGANPGALSRRVDLPYALYLLSPDGKAMRMLFPDVRRAGPIVWSPDSRWLVAPLHLMSGLKGLWLVEASTGNRFLISETPSLSSAAFLPDGRSLLVPLARTTDDGSLLSGTLAVIELPDLDQLRTR